tara:strand:- start:6701 stop:6988 length:288 start_codon:yes stop_codon:yes gene_type:complete
MSLTNPEVAPLAARSNSSAEASALRPKCLMDDALDLPLNVSSYPPIDLKNSAVLSRLLTLITTSRQGSVVMGDFWEKSPAENRSDKNIFFNTVKA